MGPSCIPPHLLLITYCVRPNRSGTPRQKGHLEIFCPLFLPSGRPYFVVSVQVCQFALAYYSPGYQENLPEEKKNQRGFMVIRLVSGAWVGNFELNSWGRRRPAASRAGRKTSLPRQALPLPWCIPSAPDYLLERVGHPWCRSCLFLQICIVLTPLPNSNRL